MMEDYTLSRSEIKGSACLECCILRNNYSKCCNVMTDIDTLSKYFVDKGIINSEEIQSILEVSKTTAEKVQKILKHISNPLESGCTENFHWMLQIMEEHGSLATRKLAQELKQMLNCSSTTTNSGKTFTKGKHKLSNNSLENKRIKLEPTEASLNHLTDLNEIPDETFLMNYIPLVSPKWTIIAIRLGFSHEEIEEILDSKENQTLSKRDSENSCCSKILRTWVKRKADKPSYYKLFETLKSRQVEFEEVVNSMRTALQKKSNPTLENTPWVDPPTSTKAKFLYMICDVVEELEKCSANIEKFKQILNHDDQVNLAVYENAKNWSELIKAFQKHQLITTTQLDWLYFIAKVHAQSSSAVKIIKHYCESVKNILLFNELPWEKPDHSEEAFLYVKTDKEPETTTIECSWKAKHATLAATGGQVNPTHAKFHSAEVGSVSYYFKIPFQTGVCLKLPQTIPVEIKQLCDDASVTHIGVMAGKRNEIIEIAQLKVTNTMNVSDGMSSEPCGNHHIHLVSKNGNKWDELSLWLLLGCKDEDNEVKKHENCTFNFQKLHKWRKDDNVSASQRVSEHCFNTQNSTQSLSNYGITFIDHPLSITVMEQYRGLLRQRYSTISRKNCTPFGSESTEYQYINLGLVEHKPKISYTNGTKCHFEASKSKEPIELQDLFKFKKEEQKCIVIEGRPGIGKTTLAYKLCEEWASGGLLKEYDAVILITLRSHKIVSTNAAASTEKRTHIETIASLFLIEDKRLQQELMKELYKKNGANTCFIFDGYDELPMTLQRRSIFTDLLDTLRNSTVVYTCRPAAIKQLKHHRVFRRIEILGFSQDSVESYIKYALKKRQAPKYDVPEKRTQTLLKMIDTNPLIKNSVYIPLNLAIICDVFSFHCERMLPKTLTELYKAYIFYNLQSYTNTKACQSEVSGSVNVLNISAFAFNGVKNNLFAFSQTHLQTYEIPDNLTLLDVTPVQSSVQSSYVYNFVHLTIQEFLAAYYLCNLPEPQQSKLFADFKDNPSFKYVWIFYSGLSQLKLLEIFESISPSSNTVSVVSKCDWTQAILCLNEANNPDLYQIITKKMNGSIDLSSYNMDLFSCSSLSYFISSCLPGSIKSLTLASCAIGDEGLFQICKALKSGSTFSNNESLTIDLDLSYNDMTIVSAIYIAELFSGSFPPIENFAFSGNYLGDQGIAIILTALEGVHTLKQVEIKDCGLESDAMEVLSQLLTNDKMSVRYLDISYNNIDTSMIECLAQSIYENSTLEVLNLSNCNLSSSDCHVLLQRCRTTLKVLDISNNRINCWESCLIDLIDNVSVEYLCISDTFFESQIASISNISTAIVLENEHYLQHEIHALSKDTFNLVKSLKMHCNSHCQSLLSAISNNKHLTEITAFISTLDDFVAFKNGVEQNTSIRTLKLCFTTMNKEWIKITEQLLLHTKANLTTLILEGTFYAEDCLYLINALSKSTCLTTLKCFPQAGFTLSGSLQFLEHLQVLNSLKILALQKSKLETEDNMVIRKMESLIAEVNKKRKAQGNEILQLFLN